MKVFKFVFLILISWNLQAQDTISTSIVNIEVYDYAEDSTVIGINPCKTAQKAAQRDISNNKYKLVLRNDGQGKSKTFSRILLKKYNIHCLVVDGKTSEFYDCYSSYVIPIIKIKFGEDIFERTKLEAKNLDKLGKGDRDVTYSKGYAGLIKLIYCEMDEKLIKKFNIKDYPIPYVTLFVNEAGEIYKNKIEFMANLEAEVELLRIISTFPKLEPATYDGIAINGTISFPVHFNKKYIKKYCR
ncbi:hypothetical protein [Rufibacter hautae]|uniref:TonB C-terminal domain-containing protein n=1 Tax=Rufibacter hautae TaxID=2595005 RepID=A0A5B6TCM9_9BACT|nr:hypothetical protein [Rufibacter hautae]KAA3437928.1 hypothetical protein FOA19_11635 [Rufibacter hautae]